MNITDALCEVCGTRLHWITGTLRLCGACLEDHRKVEHALATLRNLHRAVAILKGVRANV